jgi:hypothetical protein
MAKSMGAGILCCRRDPSHTISCGRACGRSSNHFCGVGVLRGEGVVFNVWGGRRKIRDAEERPEVLRDDFSSCTRGHRRLGSISYPSSIVQLEGRDLEGRVITGCSRRMVKKTGVRTRDIRVRRIVMPPMLRGHTQSSTGAGASSYYKVSS